MAIKFEFIGWMNEKSRDVSHDKIWGWFSNGDNTHYAFWGRRGKKVSFQKKDRWKLQNLENSKLNKGYEVVNEKKLLTIWPDFHTEVEQRLFYCVLANKIRESV